jgi:urease accessory protein
MSALPERAGAGWQARLALRFDAGPARTLLTRREHVGPLIVQRPFYPEDASHAVTARAALAVQPCHAYLIHPPGGVASGDELTLDADVGAGAHALLTTPAAAKFYRRGTAGRAVVRQRLRSAGLLEWLPQENIFYPDAAVDLSTEFHLEGAAARCIGWEIGCIGLPASLRTLEGGELRLRLSLRRDGQLLLLERFNIDEGVPGARWGLGGHAAFGTALACPAGKEELECARVALAQYTLGADCTDGLLACTLIDGVLVCRASARRTDRLRQLFVHWWQALRPRVLARRAVAPRIWAT